MADAAVEEALRAHEQPAPEPGPTFDGENKFQHAISVWRSMNEDPGEEMGDATRVLTEDGQILT